MLFLFVSFLYTIYYLRYYENAKKILKESESRIWELFWSLESAIFAVVIQSTIPILALQQQESTSSSTIASFNY